MLQWTFICSNTTWRCMKLLLKSPRGTLILVQICGNSTVNPSRWPCSIFPVIHTRQVYPHLHKKRPHQCSRGQLGAHVHRSMLVELSSPNFSYTNLPICLQGTNTSDKVARWLSETSLNTPCAMAFGRPKPVLLAQAHVSHRDQDIASTSKRQVSDDESV